MWRGRYVWCPGMWVAYRADWVWVPARYYWTPAGYAYCEGYWDYPLARRGVLFAPVAFAQPVYARPAAPVQPRSIKLDVPKAAVARAQVRDEKLARPPASPRFDSRPNAEPKLPANPQPRFDPRPKADPRSPVNPPANPIPKVDPKLPGAARGLRRPLAVRRRMRNRECFRRPSRRGRTRRRNTPSRRRWCISRRQARTRSRVRP